MNTVYVLIGYNDYDLTVVLGVYGSLETLMKGYQEVLSKGLDMDGYGYTMNEIETTYLTGTKLVRLNKKYIQVSNFV